MSDIRFLLVALFAIVSANAASAALSQLIADGAEPDLLADGFKFTEGPAADARGNLFFSDIGGNRIHYWDVEKKALSTVRENSGGADGLFVDEDGALWICELRNRRLTKLDRDGRYEVMVDSFEDGPLTGANDLWIDTYGGIYFSDSYGGSAVRTKDHRVFYRSPDGEVMLVADDFYKSNGLLGTPRNEWLYLGL